jgi:preprotein translocase subunit SecE
MAKFTQYLRDTKTELKHVIWPSRQHTIYATILVIALSVLVGYYLGIFDFIFSKGVEKVIGF